MDTYKTLLAASEEILFKEKNSKFFAYAFPVSSEDDVREHLNALRKKHPGAGHFCYAWQIGTTSLSYRANDDGEPGNSAGMPIYGQIQSFKLTNVLVVVVRFFGGVKLGIGGLISAYRTAAQMALEASEVVERTIDVSMRLNFEYKNMDKVMRIIREQQLLLVAQKMELECEMVVSVRKSKVEKTLSAFEALFDVKVSKL